jgi:hypothetical protein
MLKRIIRSLSFEKNLDTFTNLDEQERREKLYENISIAVKSFCYGDIRDTLENELNHYSYFKKRDECKTYANRIMYQIWFAIEPMNISGLTTILQKEHISHYVKHQIIFLLEDGMGILKRLQN